MYSMRALLLMGALLSLLPVLIASSHSPPSSSSPRNVLHIVLDDLRPDISPYLNPSTYGGPILVQTPNFQRLADGGLTFDRAYCQQAVCAPSRMSFSTGRRPNTTKAWNFLTHFRQAQCGQWRNRNLWKGTPLTGTRHPDGVSFSWKEGNVGETGGAGQCCTDCTAIEKCKGWNMNGTTCRLFSEIQPGIAGEGQEEDEGETRCPAESVSPSGTPCMSGLPGHLEEWTPLPQNFKRNGYLTMGVGKYFHDVNKGLGVLGDIRYPNGAGLPPLQDPPSWSNVSAQNRVFAEVKAKYGEYTQTLSGCEYTGGVDRGYVDGYDGCLNQALYCYPDSFPNGSFVGKTKESNLCDFIAYNDAVEKLSFAAALQRDGAQGTKQGQQGKGDKGFYLAVGIRRPHLSFRSPSHYRDLNPAANVSTPLQKAMDPSIAPIAYAQFPPMGGDNPFNVTNSDETVKQYRAAYYAAVSWADYCVGKLLDALGALGLSESTMVVLHSDHGWHLGEYNMWEKRSLWNNAVHVPLIMRVPWKPQSLGRRTSALVELVDLYPTVSELMQVPLPTADTYKLDGTSFVTLFEDPTGSSWGKKAALSTYPRCPRSADQKLDWFDNSCIYATERTDFGFMGYSMMIDHSDGSSYRFSMWPRWDGTSLLPDWTDVRSVELYNHSAPTPVGRSPFDAYENINLATQHPNLVKQLESILISYFSENPRGLG